MFANLLILSYILVVIIYGIFKRINCFDSFTSGVKEGTITVLNMFSYFLSFVLLVSLIESCGLIQDLEKIFSNLRFSPLILIQMLMRPISSGSSYTLMLEIYEVYGVDSFSGILSTFIHTVSDASIYIIVFYFGAVGIKRYSKVLWIGILINLFGFIISYLIVSWLF
jgi:spore maturation protein SpmB